MTSRQIIEQLYSSEDLIDCIAKVQPPEIREDLLQHVFLALLEKDDTLILELHRTSKLTAYVVKMIYNLATWNRSTFNKQKSREILTNDFDHPSETINEENIIPLHRLHWVSEKVLTLYAEHGSYRAVGEVTGIPYSTVFRLVKEAKIKIKKLI